MKTNKPYDQIFLKEKKKSARGTKKSRNRHKYHTENVPVQTYLKAAGNKTLTQH